MNDTEPRNPFCICSDKDATCPVHEFDEFVARPVDQKDLINFVKDTKTVATAVEGSMEKRAKALYPVDGDVDRQLDSLWADVANGFVKAYNDGEKSFDLRIFTPRVKELFAAHLQAAERKTEDNQLLGMVDVEAGRIEVHFTGSFKSTIVISKHFGTPREAHEWQDAFKERCRQLKKGTTNE